jgi:hypothetical protein
VATAAERVASAAAPAVATTSDTVGAGMIGDGG